MPDRQLNAGRKRRFLAQLDKALAAVGVKPRKVKRRPAESTERKRLQQAYEGREARRSYGELRSAIQALGGIRPNRDYKASEIPRELRAKPGRGLAPDEMASNLQVRGFHFEGDVDLFTDIERRREGLSRAKAGGKRYKNPQTICADLKRDSRGRFVRR